MGSPGYVEGVASPVGLAARRTAALDRYADSRARLSDPSGACSGNERQGLNARRSPSASRSGVSNVWAGIVNSATLWYGEVHSTVASFVGIVAGSSWSWTWKSKCAGAARVVSHSTSVSRAKLGEPSRFSVVGPSNRGLAKYCTTCGPRRDGTQLQ